MTSTNDKMRVPIVTGISAGHGIPDDYADWEITGFRDVRLVESTDSIARFACTQVEGDSLKEDGVFDGDMLLFRITRDYENDRLGVWQTPHGRTAKYAYYDFDGSVVLHNNHGWSKRWDASDLRLLGLVVRIERDME